MELEKGRFEKDMLLEIREKITQRYSRHGIDIHSYAIDGALDHNLIDAIENLTSFSELIMIRKALARSSINIDTLEFCKEGESKTEKVGKYPNHMGTEETLERLKEKEILVEKNEKAFVLEARCSFFLKKIYTEVKEYDQVIEDDFLNV